MKRFALLIFVLVASSFALADSNPVTHHIRMVASKASLMEMECPPSPEEWAETDALCFVQRRGNSTPLIDSWDLYVDWDSQLASLGALPGVGIMPWKLYQNGDLITAERIFVVGSLGGYVIKVDIDSGVAVVFAIEL